MDEYKLPSTENLLGGLISNGLAIGAQYLTPPRRDSVPVVATEKKLPWGWIAGGVGIVLVVVIFILRPSK
jgi:hypothetical protein